jgi:ribonuclease HI
MPWIEALLRGQKVFARAKADGSLDADGGRVEIRYKANDGKAYRAAVANLGPSPGARVMPDETCGPAAPVVAKAASAAATEAASSATSALSTKALSPTAPSPKDWVAYTDGACSGNPGPAGSGVVVVVPGGTMHEGYDWLGTGTNNIAELTAILRALEAIPTSAASIVIHTDSQYAIGVLTKGWKAKVNQALIQSIKVAIAARPRVRIVYVPGHAGVPLNERADELAREAIKQRKSVVIAIEPSAGLL